MISNKIDIIRDGNAKVVDVEEIVLGDIVKLSSGDMITGDVRFLETKDLFIDQASLTGESNPVEKEKDLNVLEQGVIIGRKTFTNILKYLKMATSGNFGNMLSIIIASIFLPMLPIHILIQNLLNDFAQIGMPFDNVDREYLQRPKKWNTNELEKYMFRFGIISTFLLVISTLSITILTLIISFTDVSVMCVT